MSDKRDDLYGRYDDPDDLPELDDMTDPDAGMMADEAAAEEAGIAAARAEEAIAPRRTRRRRPAEEQVVQSAPARPRRGYGCADLISAIFLLLTVMVVSVSVLLIANPQSPLNPFPPPSPLPRLVLATPEPTATVTLTFTPEPPTPTIATATPTETPTITATWTPTNTNTPVVGGIIAVPPTDPALAVPPPPDSTGAPPPDATRSAFAFSVKSIRFQPNEGVEGCRWQSIAGLVLNLAGQPRSRQETSLAVRISGADGSIDEFTYTGTEPQFGESGFEVFLGPTPRVADYTVQLFGITGEAISDKVTVQTRAGCDENVAVIEFSQNYPY